MKKGNNIVVSVPKKLLQGEKVSHNSCDEFHLANINCSNHQIIQAVDKPAMIELKVSTRAGQR
jgi:hypothetical protein